ncbi:MAG TPA: hypothetical protein VFH60_10610, partial [Chloroflexia bacterium]|nr:hypothetical protein [Chloroflexia bacterium]
MAQDDSRWQDLMKMQESANSPTNAASDQPSGQFSGDDIEFESFMFDPGTGPLPTLGSLNTDPNMGVVTAVNPLAADLAAPRTGNTGPLSAPPQQPPVYAPSQPAQPVQAAPSFEFAAEEVPLPPFLGGAEPQAQQQADPEPPSWGAQPPAADEPAYEAPRTAAPRGTGPLGLGAHNTGTNLAARLSQLQGEAGQSATTPRGTGPLGMRRGTGPLGGVPTSGTGPLSTPTAASTAGMPGAGQGATPGPINPAYFKAPTGPLSQRMRTGPLNAASLRPEPELTQQLEQAPTGMAQTGGVMGAFGTYIEQTQNDPNTWNDTTLSS